MGNIVVIKPSKDFEQVSGKAIRELDVLTLGVYCRMLKFGKDWDMNMRGLAAVTGLSAAKVKTCILELESRGYIRREPNQSEGGKMQGWTWYLYGNPVSADERTAAGRATDPLKTTEVGENRVLGKPTTRETDHTVFGEDYNIHTISKEHTYIEKHTGNSMNARAKKTIEERASEFKASLVEYVSSYGQPMLDAFFNYWTEPNQSRTKMRWEMEKTWETGRRLATWNAREQARPKSAAQIAEEKRKEEERRYIAALDEGTREYLKLTGQVR